MTHATREYPGAFDEVIDSPPRHNGLDQPFPDDAAEITATPYPWPDPASIPPRQCLYGRHYIRGNIGATIAAGGRAKTTLGLTEAIGQAAGRNLIAGTQLDAPLCSW